MGEFLDKNGELTPDNELQDIMEMTDEFLLDARTSIENKKTLSVPIAELSNLGAGVALLIPAFDSVNRTITIPEDCIMKIANLSPGDMIKIATKISPMEPTTMMMAVALYKIEKQLGEIAETQKLILSLLEIKDEANIEGDLETLTELINNYKHNWDNDVYVQNSHKLVMDIKRAARSNMLTYQKKVAERVSSKKLLVAQRQVKSTLSDLEKDFKYYRLSLYTYSLASMMEIMLGGNYKEEYIAGIKDEIIKMSEAYRDLFEAGSMYLEKLGGTAVEANVLKGIGTAGNTVGKLIGNIPLAKEKNVDELLQDKSSNLKKNAIGMEKEAVHQFSALSNSGTRVFIDRMEDMIQIYNHTEQICFDDKCIYLVAN